MAKPLVQPVGSLRFVHGEATNAIWNCRTGYSSLYGCFERWARRELLDDMDADSQFVLHDFAAVFRPAKINEHHV